MKQTIILLSGWKESGKDHVADILTDDFLFKKTSFAKPIKNLVSQEYNIERSLLDTPDGKRIMFDNSTSYRDLLIYHGEYERSKNENHWSNIVASEIKGDNLSNYVISDWRFPHEYTNLKSLLPDARFITIRVQRFLMNLCDNNTETSLDSFKFDNIIDNTSNDNKQYLMKQLSESLGHLSCLVY